MHLLSLFSLLFVGAAAITNQCGNVEWDPEETLRPTNEAEVVAIVNAARAEGRTVKVVGDRHSFSPLDVTDSVMVSLDSYTADPYTNLGDGTISVRAGMRLYQLYELLAADSLALPNSGTHATQSIAGAMATATHGTGNTGSMSSQLISFRMVLANGTVVTASGTVNTAIYNAAKVGYGALGIITQVRLAVVPQFKLERIIVGPLPVAEVETKATQLRSYFEGRVSWTYYPYASTPNNAIIILYAPTTAAINECWRAGPFPPPVTPAPAAVFPDGWPANTQACVDIAYKSLVLSGNTLEGCPNAYGTAMEMIVPEEDAISVVNELIAYQNSAAVRDAYSPANGVLGQSDVRYVTSDTAWLSPYTGRASAVISTSIVGQESTGFTGTEAQKALFLRDGLQRIALTRDGRPHPGKQSYFNAPLMKEVYPQFCAFADLRYRLDPTGLFMNPWLDTLFNVRVAVVDGSGGTTVECICPGYSICAAAPSAAPSSQASPLPASIDLVVTDFPTPGALTPISGRFIDFPAGEVPTDYKVILYLQGAPGGANWWIKPNTDLSTPLNPDGTFTIANWASYPPGDVNFMSFELYLVPDYVAVPNVYGASLPAGLASVAVYRRNLPRGFAPTASIAPSPPAGAARLTVTTFPARGAITAIAGNVGALATPQQYKVIMYLQDPSGRWWIKPLPGDAIPITAAGMFRTEDWASYPPGDAQFTAIQLYVVPLSTPVVDVLGGPLPGSVAAAAVLAGAFPAGFTPGAPSPTPVTPGTAPDIILSAFPVSGGLTPISGRVVNLASPASYKAVLYVKAASGEWWIKPYPDTSRAIATTGVFTFADWASNPPTDVAISGAAIYVIPSGAPVPTVLGGALPAAAAVGAVIVEEYPAGYVVPAGSMDDVQQGNEAYTAALPGGAIAGLAVGGCLLAGVVIAFVLISRRKRELDTVPPQPTTPQQQQSDNVVSSPKPSMARHQKN